MGLAQELRHTLLAYRKYLALRRGILRIIIHPEKRGQLFGFSDHMLSFNTQVLRVYHAVYGLTALLVATESLLCCLLGFVS